MVTLVKHDLEFILKQIKIAEGHSAAIEAPDQDGAQVLRQLIAEAGQAAGVDIGDAAAPYQAHLLPFGLRTVDGSYNNLIEGRETWGASDQPFIPLTERVYRNEGDDTFAYVQGGNNDYGNMRTDVVDADPRLISNLIVDQTSNNPAAVHVAEQLEAAGYEVLKWPLLRNGEAVLNDEGQPVYTYEFKNISPDIGDSAPYNGLFTLFGQFFDHGLDLVPKGNSGTI